MKKFVVEIADDGVIRINDKLCEFAIDLDKENKETDLDKKAILALANEMGYEAPFLFEEIVDRLLYDDIPDEIDEDDVE